MPALADHTLGDRMERNQLYVVILLGGLLLEIPQDFLKGVKLALVDIGLVNLIGHNDEVFLSSEGDDI